MTRGARTALLFGGARAACAGDPDRQTLAEAARRGARRRRSEGREQPRPGDGRLPQVPRGGARVLAHARGDAAPRRPQAREGVRDPRRREDPGAGRARSAAAPPAPTRRPRAKAKATRIARRTRSRSSTFERRATGVRSARCRRARRRVDAPGPAAGGARRVRSRRSRSTTRSSPPIRTIRTTIRCSTRRRARSTSWAGSTRRSP